MLLACQNPIEVLLEAAKNNKVNIIVCAGDIFHRSQPNQQTKDYLLANIVNNSDTLFIFMSGNHDYTNKARDYSSLKYLSLLSSAKKVHNVKVLEPGRYFAYENAIFWALDDWHDINEVDPPKLKDRPVIAMWHGIVPGIDIKKTGLDSERHAKLATEIAESGIHYIALGDIHKQWKIHDRCYYSGCLTQTSYVDELGALLVAVNNKDIKVKSLDLHLPKKESFKVEFTEGENTEEDVITFVKTNAKQGNLVKLKFTLPIEIYASMNKKYIKEQLKDHCLDVAFDNDIVLGSQTRIATDKIAQASSIEQEIDIILDSEKIDLDTNRLRKLILEIVRHLVAE